MSLSYLKPYARQIDLEMLEQLKQERMSQLQMPQYSQYKNVLDQLEQFPKKNHFTDGSQAWVQIAREDTLSSEQKGQLEQLAKDLIPWRKGPFQLFHLDIDAEWRSDHKWERLQAKLPHLKNKKILDIGCNNGYFMFRMLRDNPELVMGIEPVIHNYTQFQLLNYFAGKDNLKFELFGVEHVNAFKDFFDVIFSMGIIYHHRHPIAQLLDMKQAMSNGGTLILETIGIPGDEPYALFPEDRYAKMRNVWFIPTLNCLINWVKKAKFKNVEVLSDIPATEEEQRLTKWCPPPRQSLSDFLDPADPSKTIEGYPAPRRFCLKATKKD